MITYKKIYKFIVWILFLSFLVLYFSQKGGYYEALNYEKRSLTDEKIKQFEKDVKNNKKIDIDNYIIEEKKDYSNKISDFGLYTSKTFSKYFKKLIIKIFGGLDDISEE